MPLASAGFESETARIKSMDDNTFAILAPSVLKSASRILQKAHMIRAIVENFVAVLAWCAPEVVPMLCVPISMQSCSPRAPAVRTASTEL